VRAITAGNGVPKCRKHSIGEHSQASKPKASATFIRGMAGALVLERPHSERFSPSASMQVAGECLDRLPKGFFREWDEVVDAANLFDDEFSSLETAHRMFCPWFFSCTLNEACE